MTTSTDQELRAWIAEWTAVADDVDAPDVIRRHVVRRSRLLILVAVVEWALGGSILVFLVHRAATQGDLVEQIAMGLLAVITAAALAFGYWNWRGAWRPSSQATSIFVKLSFERCRRLQRAVRAGWLILAMEAVVFTPWVWYRVTRAGAAGGAPLWPWAWLVGMLTLGAIYLLWLRAWAARERDAVESLQRELGDQTE